MQPALISREITPDAVLGALSRRIGPANGATVRELATEVLGRPSGPQDERLLRKVVVQLRLDGHPVCSTPDEGYHHAANKDDLQRTCLHMASRAYTSLAQVAAMKKIAMPDFYNQLGLPMPVANHEEANDEQ